MALRCIGLLHRYPGTTFTTHVLRYQDNPDIKMIVLLGEVMNLSVRVLSFFLSSQFSLPPSFLVSPSFLIACWLVCSFAPSLAISTFLLAFLFFFFKNDNIFAPGFKVGGRDEYEICDALKSGRINKPLVAWCIGTCANMFTSEVKTRHFNNPLFPSSF